MPIYARVLFDRFNACDLGDSLFDRVFKPGFQRHLARWAADARAVETDPDEPVFGHFDQFNIAAVRLDRGPDLLKHVPHAEEHRVFCIRFGHAPS